MKAYLSSIPKLTQLAGICFIVGKLLSVATVYWLFTAHPLALPSFFVYVGLIMAAGLLAGFSNQRLHKQEKEDVVWVNGVRYKRS